GGALNGRKATRGGGTWSAVAGEWYTDQGVARVRARDGGPVLREAAEALIDCGATDVEISATFVFPKEANETGNWPPGFTIRAEGPRPTGRITPRFAWKKGSPDLEVWDIPMDTPDNRARWKETENGTPYQGRPQLITIGGSNITGSIRPG